MVQKDTGRAKDFACIEFGNEQSVQKSLLLRGPLLRGRPTAVFHKRTNLPGWNSKGKNCRGKGMGKR